MGRYSRKDMIEFANFAKSYQSSRNVEQAYQAYLGGARLKPSNWRNSIHFRMMGAETVYVDGKIVKNRYGKEEAPFPHHDRFDVISWDEPTRVLKLKTIVSRKEYV